MEHAERRTIIGVGNIFRQDDGAGIEVARHLLKIGDVHYEIIESTGEGTELLELLKSHKDVIIVDAVSSGQPAGRLHRIDVHAGPLPTDLAFGSSHAFGVAPALELARTMGWLPKRCVLIGIEGKQFGFGGELSSGVESAISRLVRELQRADTEEV